MSSVPAAVVVIDLLSDDDEAPPTNKKRPFSAMHTKDDDEIEVVDRSTVLLKESESSSTEDDVCIVGSTGPNALEDYPHSRESCVKHSFAVDPMKYCGHCFCFVCDVNASECPCWSQHCHATYEQPRWRRMRQEWKQKKSGAPAVAPAQPAASNHQAYLQRMEALRATLEQRMEAHRRHQQQDPRAEILRMAAATSRSRRRRTPPRSQPRYRRTTTAVEASARRVTLSPPATTLPSAIQKPSDVSAKALLDVLSTESLLPASRLISAPPSQVFTTTLRRDQLESLTFMRNVEQGVTSSTVTGGWLADVSDRISSTLALIASNAMHGTPTREDITYFAKANIRSPRLKVKSTVIFTSAVELWKDECTKHAPGLQVLIYNTRQPFTRTHLADADIIISSPDSHWRDDIVTHFEFHRVVADDSHVFSKLHFQSARCIAGQRRWCLSATPCTTSVFDLLAQITFLSPTGHWQYDRELHVALGGFRCNTQASFNALANVLKKCFVRHVTSHQKNQTSSSPSPPRSTNSTIYLNMSSAEQQAFGYASSSSLMSFVENGGTLSAVQQAVLFDMNESSLATTKIDALVADLKTLRLSNPSVQVVVYTQYKAMQDACVAKLQQLGISVYQVNDSTDDPAEILSEFQNKRMNVDPAILVVQVPSGKTRCMPVPPVAPRVYLMDSFLDKAVESQVNEQEGTEVEVKRFVFRYSIEANIVELHKEIAAGRLSLGNSGTFLPPEAIKILSKGINARSNNSGGATETSLLEV